MTDSSTMPYVGIPSFLTAPLCGGVGELDADVGVIGVPFDEATMNRPGTRFGPRAIREASSLYEQYVSGEGYYDVELGENILRGVRIQDCGDVELQPLSLEANHERMTEAVAQCIRRKAFPVSIGGDHSITFPLVKGAEAAGEFGIIQIDTHADVFTFYESEYTHGSPMINIANYCSFVTRFVQIGMRGFMLGEQDYTDTVKRGNTIVSADQVHTNGIDWVLSQIPEGRYYVTYDIDSMDPSIAPGVGTPEPGGLYYRQARELLRGIAKKGEIVGFDMVEVNPYYDSGNITSMLATRLTLDFLGAVFKSRS